MKLAINLPLLVYWQALGEALSLARPLGLEPARVMDIFTDTSGAPNMLKNRAASIATQLAGGNVPPTVEVDVIRKDLRTMIDEGRALGVALPVAVARAGMLRPRVRRRPRRGRLHEDAGVLGRARRARPGLIGVTRRPNMSLAEDPAQ